MAVPISNVTRRVVFTASGTGPYSFTFEILANTDIAVYKDDTLLTLTTDYTVTIASNGTGSITLTASPTGATQIAIVGNRTIQRTTDFVTGGDFFANTVNDEMDQQTIFAQQNAEGLQRSLQAPQTDPTNINMVLPRKADRAGKYLAFDSNGNPEAGPTSSDVDVVAGISDEIVTVAGISSNVTTVAGISSAVSTVASNSSNVSTVAGVSSSVSTVAGISSNVTTVAGISANVTTVAGISSAVSGVAAISSAVSAVNSNSSNINAVNSNSTNINTCATNISAIIDAPNQATAAAASAASAAASAASGMYSAVQDKSANYSVVAADDGDLIRITTTGGARTITLPAISTVSDGFKVAIVKWTSDGNSVTISRSASDVINGATSYTLGNQYSSATFVADAETAQWFAVASGLGVSNTVVDSFNGNGSTTAFTLSGDPGSENNTLVTISGVYQSKATYSVSGTTLTFSTAPPTGTANIEVVWTAPLAIGTPSDGTVTPAKLSTGAPTWDTSGNLGVGTATPYAKIQATGTIKVATGNAQGILALGDGNGSTVNCGVWRGAANAPTSDGNYLNFGGYDGLVFATGNAAIGSQTERARIDSSGYLMLNTTTNRLGERLHVLGNGIVTSSAENTNMAMFGTFGSSNLIVGSFNNIPMVFRTNNTEAARIDTSGNLLVGTTSGTSAKVRIETNLAPQDGLDIKNTTNNTGNTFVGFINYNNVIAGSISQPTATTVAYNTSSDYRLKENVQPMVGALEKVAALKPCTYTWKQEFGGTNGQGFIAHELQEVVPDCVHGTKDATRIEEYQVGTQTVTKQRQVMDVRIEEREEIVLVDGKRVLRMVEHEVEVPLFEEVNVYNEDGSLVTVTIPAVLDEDGNVVAPETTVPRTTQVPVMQEYEEEEPVMGEREVPSYQGIDTSFLVATLTAAIQELKAELDAAKARITTLEGA